jgi:hypothetical protein
MRTPISKGVNTPLVWHPPIHAEAACGLLIVETLWWELRTGQETTLTSTHISAIGRRSHQDVGAHVMPTVRAATC